VEPIILRLEKEVPFICTSTSAVLFSGTVIVIVTLKPFLAKSFLGWFTYYRGCRKALKK
jgi:hypothetical protein